MFQSPKRTIWRPTIDFPAYDTFKLVSEGVGHFWSNQGISFSEPTNESHFHFKSLIEHLVARPEGHSRLILKLLVCDDRLDTRNGSYDGIRDSCGILKSKSVPVHDLGIDIKILEKCSIATDYCIKVRLLNQRVRAIAIFGSGICGLSTKSITAKIEGKVRANDSYAVVIESNIEPRRASRDQTQ